MSKRSCHICGFISCLSSVEEEERRAEDGVETEAKADEALEEKKPCEEANNEETTSKAHRSESSASSEDSIISCDKVGFVSPPCHSGHHVICRSAALTSSV